MFERGLGKVHQLRVIVAVGSWTRPICKFSKKLNLVLKTCSHYSASVMGWVSMKTWRATA